jgi:hypothetical protein
MRSKIVIIGVGCARRPCGQGPPRALGMQESARATSREGHQLGNRRL